MALQIATTLSNCEREPIHVPLFVQKFGCIIAVHPKSNVVVQCSLNVKNFLNVSATGLMGKSIAHHLHADALSLFKLQMVEIESGIKVSRKIWDSLSVVASVSKSNDLVLLELEESAKEPFVDFESNLGSCSDNDVEAALADEVRRLTHFHRVMIYKYDALWNGDVVAESKGDELGSFLHHKFPAADMPAIVRDMYFKNPERLIADIDSAHSPLFDESKPVNLSLARCRGVSPIHVQYLRNMKVKASASFAIFVHEKLWGIVACHHSEGKYFEAAVGEACLKRTQLAGSRLEARRRELQISLETNCENLKKSLQNILKPRASELFEIVKAYFSCDGITLIKKDGTDEAGVRLSKTESQKTFEILSAIDPHSEVVATDSLIQIFPDLYASGKSEIAGVAAFRIGDSTVIFYRKSIAQNILWGGNPSKELSFQNGMLNPRKSFETWVQNSSFASQPWSETDLESLRLMKKVILL